MKIAIVGSRDYPRLELVTQYVLALPPDTIVISGGARGVDKVAETVARRRGLQVQILKPNWDAYPKKAGMLRNSEIVRLADKVVAYWDGVSPGTADCIRKAKVAKKPVELYDVDGELQS